MKTKVKENPLVPTNQIYETELAEERTSSINTLPYYVNLKDRFRRVRAQNKQPNATSLATVVVSDKKTKDGRFGFLIFDNHKPNRILVFASPTCLKILSENDFWHSDGTYHTKRKYFRQLYNVHSYRKTPFFSRVLNRLRKIRRGFSTREKELYKYFLCITVKMFNSYIIYKITVNNH